MSDEPRDWDALPLWTKLRRLAERIDQVADNGGQPVAMLDVISTTLDALATEVFEYCRDHGVTL